MTCVHATQKQRRRKVKEHEGKKFMRTEYTIKNFSDHASPIDVHPTSTRLMRVCVSVNHAAYRIEADFESAPEQLEREDDRAPEVLAAHLRTHIERDCISER